ncbi:MAG: S8 family serine peptidase, partial [Acidimicrobiia bacterium]|nr:S8 family serine peptidase [Acidimicrobiia bacterium]
MKRSLSLVVVVGMLTAVTPAAVAQSIERPTERRLPETVEAQRLDAPHTTTGGLPMRDQPTGAVAVVVHLPEPAIATAAVVDPAAEKRRLERRQTALVERLAGRYGATEIARVQIVLNAVFIEVDADALPAIAREAGVRRVVPVAHYEAALSETVPLIGAAEVQAAGLDGSGVRVAVLDSGIDYTHAALGGPGTTEAYAAAYGEDPADPRNTTRDSLFPTDRVVGGFDFVGEVWPNGDGGFAPDDLAFDPDPIDFEGHGTHVADIIGGTGGVAPAADLYAVKVCSAVASSCNGISLIMGLEFAVDPNADGVLDDRVDIINMSLGSVYGQPFDDDLALAVDNATAAGVLTVASAGNGADKPYVIGTPSAAPTALAVAQTYVPSASVQGIDITDPAPGQVGAIFQDWSAPLTESIGPAPVAFAGLGCSLGDDPNSVEDEDAPFEPGQLDGRVALVNRGECNFSIKVFNVQRAGAVAAIIGLVGPGEPFSGAFGAGGPFSIPGYMVGQRSAAALVDTTVVISPDSATAAAGNVVGSSSRGPSSAFQMVKPEIGAPGASISAVAGSGSDVEPFGG